MVYGERLTGGGILTYIKTKLRKEIQIESIITLHYFEYMKNFIFHVEAHDFWEFLYVDNGTVSVRSDDTWMTLNTCHQIYWQEFSKPDCNFLHMPFSGNETFCT